jgi:tripartite motif-containing protein 2/3
MESNFSALVENVITCPVCLKHFDQPRMLDCKHTFCFQCIEQMASQNNGLFECPKRDGIQVEKDKINALPLNQFVRELVQLFGERSDSCYQQAFLKYQLKNFKKDTFISAI